MYLLHHCTFIIRKSFNLVSAINWTLSKVINLLVLLTIELQRIDRRTLERVLGEQKKKKNDDTQRLILDLIDQNNFSHFQFFIVWTQLQFIDFSQFQM